ncbi:MAG: CdaR family protein [Blastocatellia bacterium]
MKPSDLSDDILRLVSPARLWQRLRHLHVEHKGLKLLSLALAILLFIVSRQPVSDVRLFNVPLEYRGQSSSVEISGDAEQTVSVRVRGPRDVVRNLMPSQLSVVADLSHKEPGERVVQLHADDVTLPDNSIRVTQIEPASIRLMLEPKMKKRVAIKAQFMGQLPADLEMYHATVEPSEVELEGPQSQLNKVNLVLTETVNLSGRDKDFQATVDVETPHRSLRVLTPSPIKLSIEIGERRSLKRFGDIPVTWPDPPAGGRLLTKTVEVELYGTHSLIESLRAKDLYVEVKTINWSNGAGVAEPTVTLPETAAKRIEVRNVFPKEVRLKR